jgi:flagellar hook protein FlgE
MMTGVAGLGAYSNSLSVASANIANVNTVAYKTGTANFSTLLAAAANGNTAASASVVATPGQNVSTQGLLQPTESATDLAISGNGFFVVTGSPTDTSARAYTRAGNFTANEDGYLKNSAGYFLLGWKLDANGNVPSDRNDMSLINANSLTGKAEATTRASAKINLQSTIDPNPGAATYAAAGGTIHSVANGDVKADFQRTINVFDSQGGQRPLQLSFVKTAANTWAYEVSYTGPASDLDSTGALVAATPALLQYGTITFTDEGELTGVTSHTAATPPATPTSVTSSDGTYNIHIPWKNSTSGLMPQDVTMDCGAFGTTEIMQQFANPSNMASSKVNGALFGTLTGVSVDKDGIVTANFSNGLSQKVYKVPLATFANPDGLTQTSGNAYTNSSSSGSPTINEANLGGAGEIKSKNVEGSTVDLATEFTSLITTQRAYSAASKIVTTASTMLDELLQMAR